MKLRYFIVMILFTGVVFCNNSWGEETKKKEIKSLSPFSKILGNVVDRTNGESITGAYVVMGNREEMTGSDGLFEFDPVLIGRYSVTAKAHGYNSKTEIIYVIPPLTTFKIELEKKFHTSKFKTIPHLKEEKIDLFSKASVKEYVINPPVMEEEKKEKKINRKITEKRKNNNSDWVENSFRISKGVKGNKLKRGKNEYSHRDRYNTSRGFTDLSGSIIDEDTGSALGNVLIELGPRMLKTDEAGKFSVNGIPADRFNILFSKKGYLTESRNMVLRRDGNYLKIKMKKK